ncbi:protein of unknown function [Clostridium cavendishii DSM 21758]|uniref:DUF1540 domain-containing protein n=1 Tax=Clostridium cavendishii DSM 21758 TaxID=1121302 RepID=A0A1M6SB05_9CLOT|nr:DUF1540 domain-containing protein [Clostridium cavendishii]SHK41952.1 protein of unknown function [Clostridium cavendishii DSM 21758]
MTKVGCSAEGCVNNIGGMCSAGTISIQGIGAHSSSGTECKTFAKKNFKNAFKSIANTNYTGEIIQSMVTDDIVMNPDIICNATNCEHNLSNRCMASDIQVFGPKAKSSHGTQCETFRDR